MKIIVGLGNIGKEYEDTRHNFGFLVMDHLVHKRGLRFKESSKFKGAWTSENSKQHEKIYYLKPHTYMNLSGEAVQALSYYFKIPAEDVFVVYDDLDLELGSVRLASGGGAGGHKGIRSIMTVLGTQDVPRLKLGIGKPKYEGQEVSSHVLDRFRDDEIEEVNKLLDHAVKAIDAYLKQGIIKAMNGFNKVKKKASDVNNQTSESADSKNNKKAVTQDQSDQSDDSKK
ncbi:MAG: aminoacyl-tRNA hydrolase [bacterium]